ncbi:hypothetical protein TVAG_528830 [Trichomonas vaginalis G3]|uniref:Uncharacterized protein n=1 Tax=Trichomonas vaginalis (strain ATCC PRA-98 / G3) TaxID=412133 RepID=A2G977_TRIV3|nr:hypothetical protein TVAG_528830 [Trichomonas vaginalis G3]|eukprot:XP_001299222.1 hypothetical protein [Trichomonas vaginalis G3]
MEGPSTENPAYPNCPSQQVDGYFHLPPNGEICFTENYLIASNGTDYEIEAKFKDSESDTLSDLGKVFKPFAVNSKEDSKVYSKVKCLNKTAGCKFQAVSTQHSMILNETYEPEREGGHWLTHNDYKVQVHFSTKSSGSLVSIPKSCTVALRASVHNLAVLTLYETVNVYFTTQTQTPT